MRLRDVCITVFMGAIAVAVPTGADAAGLERTLEERWLGAWVITSVETRSDCGGLYTNNRINGSLVHTGGRHGFEAGELAQVERIDLKRSRLDLKLRLPEPIRVSYQDGPFTLYQRTACRIELEIELPRAVVARADLATLDRTLAPVLARYASEAAARRSGAWNGREVDPYPEDYDRTLVEHAAWKAEQVNAAVQVRLDEAAAEVVRVTDRITSDADYVAGFAQGVERAQATTLGACETMAGRGVTGFVTARATPTGGLREESDRRRDRGFEDGQRLVLGLELQRRLPACFVSAPEIARDR